jgi:hypothetical protein
MFLRNVGIYMSTRRHNPHHRYFHRGENPKSHNELLPTKHSSPQQSGTSNCWFASSIRASAGQMYMHARTRAHTHISNANWYPHHCQRVEALQPEDYAAQVDSCRLIVEQHRVVEHFFLWGGPIYARWDNHLSHPCIGLWNISFHEEVQFTRDGITVRHIHAWSPNDPQLPASFFGECVVRSYRQPTKWTT